MLINDGLAILVDDYLLLITEFFWSCSDKQPSSHSQAYLHYNSHSFLNYLQISQYKTVIQEFYQNV